MNLKTKIELILKNKEGDVKKVEYSFKNLLNKTIEDIYDELEEECTSSGCNNESQNFCDCGPQYEDFEIKEFNVLNKQ